MENEQQNQSDSELATPALRHLREAILAYDACQRLGTVKTKTRAEVAGASRKLYKQKGTGRARAGNRRTPVRVGGGHAFAKTPKSWRKSIGKRSRAAATTSALAQQKVLNRVLNCDLPPVGAVCSTTVRTWLGDAIQSRRLLIVTAGYRPDLARAFRNYSNVTVAEFRNLNVKQLAVARCVVLDAKAEQV